MGGERFRLRTPNLGLQSRVWWTLEPGNDFYFISGQGSGRTSLAAATSRRRDTRLVAKLPCTFRC